CGNQLQGDAQHDCLICKMTYTDKNGETKNMRPSTQSVGLAVIRQDIVENGRVVGIEDYTHQDDVKFTLTVGEEKQEVNLKGSPYLAIVKQSPGNFWDSLTGY